MTEDQLPDANMNLAVRLGGGGHLTVREFAMCGGCGKPADVLVQGRWPRCQPCANKVLNIWSTIRERKLQEAR